MRLPQTNAGFVDANGKRITHIEKLVIDQAAKNADHQNIENGADHQRTQNADRHIARGILGFLRRSGNGVKADIGEENYRCAAADAGPSILAADAGVWRHKRMPVNLHQLRMIQQIVTADGDKHNQDADLYIDDGGVEVG